MPVSPYFKLFENRKDSEMQLYEELLVESIQIYGHNIYYLPREDWDTRDQIFGENVQSIFQKAYVMEMYIGNVDGFKGQGDFFSKFGLEVRENANFIIAKRTFDKYIPTSIAIRPREGDLLFVPAMNKIMEIKFVEDELMFFTLGRRLPYVYELRCEDFRYSNEPFNTGVATVDTIKNNYVYTLQFNLKGLGDYNLGEVVYQGANLAVSTASATVSNWDPANSVISINEIRGQFANSGNITGVDSGTSKIIKTADTYPSPVFYDINDNKSIQVEADNILVLDTNPFGNPGETGP